MQNEQYEPKKKGNITINYFWLIILFLTTVIGTALLTTLTLEAGSEKAVNVGTDTRSEFSKLYSVYDTLTSEYYEEVDREALIESSIDGMVNGLEDPFSEYLNTEETEQFNESITGDFEGIGAEVMQMDNVIVITSPMRGSPAEEAGLEPGDKVLQVDGESIEGYNTFEAVQLIRGEKGTDVVLTIQRGEDVPFDVTITRDQIHIDSVTYESIDGIAHISVNRFQVGTAEEFQEAVEEALSNEDNDLIIDFRFNPGGLLDEAVNMINTFINRGETVLILENNEGEQSSVEAPSANLVNLDDFESVYILQNEGSASASEVFTGALNDLEDVTVAGTTSFGKGTVQRTSEFGDSSMLKFTNTKWLTPNGTWVHETGIDPEVELVNPDYYRVEVLNSEEVYTEDQENPTVVSIKVAMDALGYEITEFSETFTPELTNAIMSFQSDQGLEETGDVTGETSAQIMSELRTFINENDAQLNYLIDYINGEYTKSEIETFAEDNAQHIEIIRPDHFNTEENETPDSINSED